MFRKSSSIAAVALLVPVLASCGDSDSAAADCKPKIPGEALVKPGVLTYSVNATLPPMQYVKDGELVGMRIEMATELAKRLCLEPEPVNVPFDAQIPGAQGGRWDVINTGMFYTAERADALALVPYEVQAVAVSVTKDAAATIDKPEDLSGLTVGVEAPGYEFDAIKGVNNGLVEAGLKPMNINTSLTNADAFQALAAGQIDGVATVEAVTTFYQSDGRFTTAIKGLNRAPSALGFAKSNTEVAEAVANELQAMKEDGFLGDLFDGYAVTPYEGKIEVTTGELADK